MEKYIQYKDGSVLIASVITYIHVHTLSLVQSDTK